MSKSHRNIRLVWEEENRETNFKRKFVIAWKLINEWFVEIGSAKIAILLNAMLKNKMNQNFFVIN